PVCTAADVIAKEGTNCPNSTAACTITKNYSVANGCTLDFGTRAVSIKSGSETDIFNGTVTIKAGTLTIQPGGYINGRGDGVPPHDRGGFISIITTGAVSIQKANALGKIDVSGNTAAGTIAIAAGGSVTVDGRLDADNLSTTAGGGAIQIQSGG